MPAFSSLLPPPPSTACGRLAYLLVLLGSILTAIELARDFDAAPFPTEYNFWVPSVEVPEKHMHAKHGIQHFGRGKLRQPEDIAFDKQAGAFYTGCGDGWIKRVTVPDLKVENWAYVGGRPLGVSLTSDNTLAVANAGKGLQLVRGKEQVELLTNKAEGVEFSLLDAVDVTINGEIYFTDACTKYKYKDSTNCFLEGRPYGVLLRFDPSSNETTVVARDLFFAAGATLSADQDSVIVTESMLRRCRRFYISGAKKGTSEIFIDNLPGFPDNIRYDGEGHYWIALAEGRTLVWDIILWSPFLRRALVGVTRYVKFRVLSMYAGIMSVDLQGNPLALYTDRGFDDATGGVKSGNHVYFISILKKYMRRFEIPKHSPPTNN